MSVTSGTAYVITNVRAGTVIDLSLGDNRTVTGWASNGGSNQKWILEWTGNSWTFRNQYSGGYLGINSNPVDGVPLVAQSSIFNWDIWPDAVNPSAYRIFVPNTLENFELSGEGRATSGDPITLWTTWNATHQTWTFNPA